ncbi:MAG: PepSY-associated TM helix domain-containing protein [Pseudomonadota bacterium]
MDRERHLRNYDLHSWSGIALGLFVYVVCFTGCFALFHHEMLSWEDPAKRLTVAEEPAAMSATFEAWVTKNAGGEPVSFARFSYPNEFEPYFVGGMTVKDADGRNEFIEQRWDTHTGAPIPERGAGLSEWLLDFHRDLMWPDGLGGRTAGRTLVGIVGVILMLSIVSGVVAHTKIFQELFTLRYLRSVRLKWQDTHKVLGLWGLPFYTMIAFTGAVLGVVAILSPIVALLTFKGDQEALIAAVLGAPVEPAGIVAPMLSVDDLAGLKEPTSGEPVAFIVMNNWGDENARFDIYFEADTELAQVDGYQIDGVTGERIADSQFETTTLGNRFVNAVSPLHYGTYGGLALKFLYFLLGLSLAVITALGMMMWVERRLFGNAGARSPWVYKSLSHLTAGATAGLPLATGSIFYLDKLFVGGEATRLYWTGVTYFAVWGAGVLYAFLRRNDYGVVREMLLLSGLLFAGLPVLNAATTDAALLSIFNANHKIDGFVDLTFLITGLITVLVAWRLPRRRKRDTESRIVSAPDITEASAASAAPVAAE